MSLPTAQPPAQTRDLNRGRLGRPPTLAVATPTNSTSQTQPLATHTANAEPKSPEVALCLHQATPCPLHATPCSHQPTSIPSHSTQYLPLPRANPPQNALELADLREEIVFQETQTWEALKQSGQALLPYLTSDCIMVFAGAKIFDAHSDPTLSEILARPDMKPWLKYEMDEIRVMPLGRDAAAISYSVEAHRKKKKYNALICSVWRYTAEGWRMCLHQQTPSHV